MINTRLVHLFYQFLPDVVVQWLIWSRCVAISVEHEYHKYSSRWNRRFRPEFQPDANRKAWRLPSNYGFHMADRCEKLSNLTTLHGFLQPRHFWRKKTSPCIFEKSETLSEGNQNASMARPQLELVSDDLTPILSGKFQISKIFQSIFVSTLLLHRRIV